MRVADNSGNDAMEVNGMPEDGSRRKVRRVKTFPELLERLKEEYLELLQKSVSFAEDEFGVKHGYISARSNTDLYLPEAKLRIIALEIGDNTIEEWISRARANVLKSVVPTPPQMALAYTKTLDGLCNKLKTTMDDGIIFYQYQGKMVPQISDANRKKMHILARQIVSVGQLLAQDRYHWLVQTWKDFEKAHQ
ncbi:MAG: hypothetical protein NC217_01280 [Muribaculaceae bacterium]|nr:hypothetical protein [Muribaculaceae bacterium]